MPAQDDLGRGLARSPGSGLHRGGVEALALPQRRPALGDDPVLGMEGPQRGLLEAGIDLDLVQDGGDASLADDPCEMRLLEVRHADGQGAALLAQPDQRAPGVEVQVLGRAGPVDQEEIDMGKPQSFQACLGRTQGRVEPLLAVPDFRRDED